MTRRSRKSRRVLSTVSVAMLASVGFCAGASAVPMSCERLTSISLPDTTITLAQSYASGQTVSGTIKAPVGLCRVASTVKPSSDLDIKFEVWIPTDGSWNGKYEQLGNGGFAGSIWVAFIANAVSRGYAAAATDDGTSGPPSGAPTLLGHPDLQKDYGFRAIKVTTDTSKIIIEELMGKKPRYSYFNGCSCGGREALMEAQRFPHDFDGIIVGSPANDLVGLLGASFLWNMQALLNGPQTDGVPDAYIPASKLGLLSSAALIQCAGKDGGVSTDAFLNDPSKCHFDPAVVACKSGQDPNTCLTKAQVEAAKKIYWGPHNLRGQLIFPGYEPGSNSYPANWPNWLVGTSSSSPGGQNSLAKGFWCDEVFGKANCPYLSINIDKEFQKARKAIAPIVNSTNPDLRSFKRRGGKMIQYAGWADTAVAPENGLNYYEKVEKGMRDVHDFYRVFMAPGMAHCYGGAGPNSFGNGASNGPVIDAKHDLLKSLELWVEQGVAPDKIIATKYVNDDPLQGVALQRPLCPYPQIAKYDGRGKTTAPSSFKCIADKERRARRKP